LFEKLTTSFHALGLRVKITFLVSFQVYLPKATRVPSVFATIL